MTETIRWAYDAKFMVGRRTLLSSLTAAALAPASAFAQQSQITIGTTSSEGGTYALYGAAFLDMLKSVDPLLEVRVVPSKGPTENAALLKRGDIDIGLVSGEVTHEVLSTATQASDKLKVVSAMYASPGMFAVRADSRFHRISDLKGRPIVWNMRGSGITLKARYVMDGLGLDMDRDFQPIYPEHYMDGPALVLHGDAAALWGSGFRWPAFVALANAPIGARFVVPDAAEIERVRAKYDFMARLTVPARLYPGQYDPIETVGSWSFLLARADLPDAIGYRLAASLHKAERTGALAKQLTQTTAKNTLLALSGPDKLQPGVAQYYQKVGLLK